MISKYFSDITRVLAVGAGFAALPLFAALASLEPPWPPAIGFVSAGIIVVGALIIWEWTRKANIRNRRKWLVWATALMLVGLLFYLVLYSLYVETVPGTNIRIVRGFQCTIDAELVYREQCSELPSSALDEAGWDVNELWTRTSITTVRVGLATCWLVFTAGLVMAVGSVVAGRRV